MSSTTPDFSRRTGQRCWRLQVATIGDLRRWVGSESPVVRMENLWVAGLVPVQWVATGTREGCIEGVTIQLSLMELVQALPTTKTNMTGTRRMLPTMRMIPTGARRTTLTLDDWCMQTGTEMSCIDRMTIQLPVVELVQEVPSTKMNTTGAQRTLPTMRLIPIGARRTTTTMSD